MYRGRPKNSSSCVSVEYTSQATSTNPHFFGSRPPLDIFRRMVYNYFCCYFILVFGWSDDVKNLLKYIIMLLRRVAKALRKISQWKSWKIRTGQVRAAAPPTPKIQKNAVLLFNFFLSTKPTSRENANNSHLILFHILLVRNILRQRGRFICKSFSFAFYYLLNYVVNSKVLLFANNYHLNIISI